MSRTLSTIFAACEWARTYLAGFERRPGAPLPRNRQHVLVRHGSHAWSGGVGYAVLTAVNGGSRLLIFVPRATHSHDLSLAYPKVRTPVL